MIIITATAGAMATAVSVLWAIDAVTSIAVVIDQWINRKINPRHAVSADTPSAIVAGDAEGG